MLRGPRKGNRCPRSAAPGSRGRTGPWPAGRGTLEVGAHVLEIASSLPRHRQPPPEGSRGGEGEELVRLAEHPHQFGLAKTRPTFQPVMPKILRRNEILTVRSRMPGDRHHGRCRRPSKITCSHTSSHTAMTSKRVQKSAMSCISSRECTTPVGSAIVEQHHLGARREGRLQLLGGDAPGRRLQPHQPRNCRPPAAREADRRHRAAGTAPPRRPARSARTAHPASASVAPDVTITLALGIEVEALPMLVVHRRRLPQIGKAHHGRILVPAIDHGVRRLLAHVQRPRIIGKALSEFTA